MRRKEYVEKIKNAILNRIRFHAPIVYDTLIDRRALFEYGVDVNLPIFKYEKKLDKHILKAFELAGEEEKFNLLIPSYSTEGFREKDFSKLKNLVVFNPDTCTASFLESINKLNINYYSASNYNVVFKDKYFKVQGQILNPHFDNFSLEQVGVFDGVFVQYSEFVLNGNNYHISLQNKSNTQTQIKLELNLPLEKGYYYFKRMSKYISIENLLSKEKFYLNFICRGAKFKFSDVDGLENSVFCCVNACVTLNLKPNEELFVYFNFGQTKFALKGEKEIKYFKEISRRKCCDTFNIQVKTKNPNFDNFFNKILPQKIWICWANGDDGHILEEKYLTLKKLFINCNKEKFNFVNFKEIGLREIGIFNGEYYKKIIFIHSEQNFLRVGRTFFYNINSISKKTLLSSEPILISFAN